MNAADRELTAALMRQHRAERALTAARMELHNATADALHAMRVRVAKLRRRK